MWQMKMKSTRSPRGVTPWGIFGGGLLLLINVAMIFLGPSLLPAMDEVEADQADDAPESGQRSDLVGGLFHPHPAPGKRTCPDG